MSLPETLLVVDDDREIRHLLGEYLEKSGYRVELAANGTQMMDALSKIRVDLVILDLMMPGEDGLALCQRMRAHGSEHNDLPVLMLSARSDPIDRILGLEIGADDYLSKPFTPRELLARVRAILKRVHSIPQGLLPDQVRQFRFAGWTVDCQRRELANTEGQPVVLTGGEYRLLRVLLSLPNRVLSRDQLLDMTQGRETEPFDRSIDVLISRLRQRLNDDGRSPQLIKTVRNQGYVLAAEVSRD